MSQSENSGCESNVVGAVSQLETLSLEQPREITFVFPGEKISVSETFLAASSPIFKAMFEDGKDEVPITDMHPDTFKWMLLYINGSDLPEDKEVFNNLLVAAEKYELHKVNNLRLMSSITKDNWLMTALVAFVTKNLEKMNAVFEFFWMVPHMEVVAHTKTFLNFQRKNRDCRKYFLDGSFRRGKTPKIRFDSHYDISGSMKSTKIILEKRRPDLSYFYWGNELRMTEPTSEWPQGYWLDLLNSMILEPGKPPFKDGDFIPYSTKHTRGHSLYRGMKVIATDEEFGFEVVPHATETDLQAQL